MAKPRGVIFQQTSGAVDVLITDCQMPYMTGVELVRRARAAGFGGLVIVQTANLTPDVLDELAPLEVDEIVIKNARPETLVELIKRLKKVPCNRCEIIPRLVPRP